MIRGCFRLSNIMSNDFLDFEWDSSSSRNDDEVRDSVIESMLEQTMFEHPVRLRIGDLDLLERDGSKFWPLPLVNIAELLAQNAAKAMMEGRGVFVLPGSGEALTMRRQGRRRLCIAREGGPEAQIDVAAFAGLAGPFMSAVRRKCEEVHGWLCDSKEWANVKTSLDESFEALLVAVNSCLDR